MGFQSRRDPPASYFTAAAIPLASIFSRRHALFCQRHRRHRAYRGRADVAPPSAARRVVATVPSRLLLSPCTVDAPASRTVRARNRARRATCRRPFIRAACGAAAAVVGHCSRAAARPDRDGSSRPRVAGAGGCRHGSALRSGHRARGVHQQPAGRPAGTTGRPRSESSTRTAFPGYRRASSRREKMPAMGGCLWCQFARSRSSQRRSG